MYKELEEGANEPLCSEFNTRPAKTPEFLHPNSHPQSEAETRATPSPFLGPADLGKKQARIRSLRAAEGETNLTQLLFCKGAAGSAAPLARQAHLHTLIRLITCTRGAFPGLQSRFRQVSGWELPESSAGPARNSGRSRSEPGPEVAESKKTGFQYCNVAFWGCKIKKGGVGPATLEGGFFFCVVSLLPSAGRRRGCSP